VYGQILIIKSFGDHMRKSDVKIMLLERMGLSKGNSNLDLNFP
jgi:hypothetical protein